VDCFSKFITAAALSCSAAAWNQQAGSRLSVDQEVTMAVNKPTGDFMDQKKAAAKKKYKGVRKER
jgi:hypothetical protein